MAKSLGMTLIAIALVIGLMVLVLRKGPIGGLVVVLLVAVAIFGVTALSVMFGKRKKNGQDV